MALRDQLRIIRERAGLSQTALAKAIKIARPSVTQIESGRSAPSIEVAERWVAACGASLVALPVGHSLVDHLLAEMDEEQRNMVLDLVAVLPALEPARIHDLGILIAGWQREKVQHAVILPDA